MEMEKTQNNQNTFERTKMENLHRLISKSIIKVSDKGSVALAERYVKQWNGRESPHRPTHIWPTNFFQMCLGNYSPKFTYKYLFKKQEYSLCDHKEAKISKEKKV